MYTKITLFLLCKLLWAYPIFLPPPVNPILWTIKSPKIQQAFNAYNNFRYQNCLSILKDSISTITPSKEFDWLAIELRMMSWVQLGAVEKIHSQIVELRKLQLQSLV